MKIHDIHTSIFKAVSILFLCLSFASLDRLTAQDTTDRTSQKEDKIWFSTVPNTAQKSLEPYHKALKDATFGEQRFSIFEQLAAHHIQMGDSDSIIYYGNRYLRELKDWDKSDPIKSPYFSKAYFILGMGSKLNGLLDNAIKWHITGIREAESVGATELLIKNKIALANIYNLKTEPQKAISLVENNISIIEKEWTEYLPDALTYLGDAQYSLKKYDQAKESYGRALQKSKTLNNLKQELTINLKIGGLAELENRMDDAFDLYNQTKESALQNRFNTLYFEGSIRLGRLFYHEKNYEAAIAALSIAYVNAIERDNLQYQKEILDIQRRVFAAKKDYSNAYAVMTQLARVNSRISTQQQQKVIKELEVQYETLEKEKAITSLQEEQILRETELQRQKTIKNSFLVGFLIILIPIMALLYVYYQKIQAQSELAKKQAEINTQKVTALKQEQELNLIKASIEGQDEERKRVAQELHDSIGGNLAGIKLQVSGLAESSDKWKSISGQLDETYQLVRDISHALIPEKFKQNGFNELIEEYIKSISKTVALEIEFHPHPEREINTIDEKIQVELYKIIQELMTNTLKHAQAKKVDIHLSLIHEELSLLFEDDGIGFSLETDPKGIGLNNIQERVSGLGGNLHIDSVFKRGTVIAIDIPIKNQTA